MHQKEISQTIIQLKLVKSRRTDMWRSRKEIGRRENDQNPLSQGVSLLNMRCCQTDSAVSTSSFLGRRLSTTKERLPRLSLVSGREQTFSKSNAKRIKRMYLRERTGSDQRRTRFTFRLCFGRETNNTSNNSDHVFLLSGWSIGFPHRRSSGPVGPKSSTSSDMIQCLQTDSPLNKKNTCIDVIYNAHIVYIYIYITYTV